LKKLSALIALLVFAFALSAPSGVAAKAAKAKVSVKIISTTQASVLKSNRVKVRVKSNSKVVGAIALYNANKTVGRLNKVKLKPKSKRTISIKLTSAGRKRIATCGSKSIRAVVKYRRGKKKVSAKTKRTLSRDSNRCDTDGPAVVPPNPSTTAGCDPIDPAACMAPFPNDYFTRLDSSTDTGLRANFEADKGPKNSDGKPAFNDAYNRNDGFSPNSVIVTRIAGIDNPTIFRENSIVSQMNIGAYADSEQRVVLIDTTNNQRVPIWAELDMVPGTPNPHAANLVQGTPQDRALLIHPAQSLEYGRRYVVALRNMTAGGSPVPVNEVFKYLRDGVTTSNPQVEERRAQLADVFSATDAAGLGRNTLNAAWEFTVASERNLTERVIAMRTDAFNQLGDTNLANGSIEGNAPDMNNVVKTNYDPCPDANTACGNNQRRYAFAKVTGTITVPCYMNAPGTEYTSALGNPDTPCASGSRLNYAPGSDLPTQKMDGNTPVTWESPFTCILPRTSENAPTQATSGLGAIVFGHGLLGDRGTTEALGNYPSALEGVACGTDWIGLSSSDITQQLLKMINVIGGGSDLSIFPSLPDRTQQGYINTLYLARALAHKDGFASLPQFQVSTNPVFSINQNDPGDELAYYGVSLGGINGGATTAIAPDWERATLAVPGIGYSTLLTRSTQFNQFLPTVYAAYTNPVERTIGMSMLQMLWDRGEPSAYAKSMLNGGLGTPTHEVLIQESFGDHQVANTQTQTLARTIGATVKAPILTPGRIDDLATNPDPDGKYLFTDPADVDPYWNLPVAPSSQFNVAGGLPNENAVMMTTDTGPVVPGGPGMPPYLGTMANPDWNIAPVSGTPGVENGGYDPHQPGATSPATQQMLMPFLLDQGYFDPCGNGAPDIYGQPPFATPISSLNPVPCTAPAIDYIRNGR